MLREASSETREQLKDETLSFPESILQKEERAGGKQGNVYSAIYRGYDTVIAPAFMQDLSAVAWSTSGQCVFCVFDRMERTGAVTRSPRKSLQVDHRRRTV
jgi:hypothetical protein